MGLQDIVELAEKVGGKNHHFDYAQLPFNFSMIDSFFEKWQVVKENNKDVNCTIFEAAEKLNINIITSVPLAQGLMIQYPLSTKIYQASHPGAEHLQFVRSAPSKALISKF